MKEYLEFIESCRNKVYDCPTQKHHIIPISIGGASNSTNTIYLSYEDHWRAHVMLAEVFPNNKRLSAVGHATLEEFIRRVESHQGKKIRCIETGIVYNSLREASEILGISVPAISLNLTGKRPSAGKLHFEYV